MRECQSVYLRDKKRGGACVHGRETDRQTESDRQTDRRTDRYRQTDRQTDGQTERGGRVPVCMREMSA